MMAMGLDVYATRETLCAIGGRWPERAKEIACGKQTRVGTMIVKPFDTAHDCAGSCGFLVHSVATGERLIFATDTAYIGYRFPGVTEMAIECNYSESTIMQDSKLPKKVIDRIMRTHMSAETALRWLKASDLSTVKTIWLIHASATYGDVYDAQKKIQAITHARVLVAEGAV